MTGAGGHYVVRGWHVLAGLVAFFGVVIVVNIYFAFAAVGTFPGEDVTHPYIQGLEYNRTLAAHRLQQAQGWRASAVLRPGADGALLEIELFQRDGAPLSGARLAAVLRWPADAHRDRTLVFHERAPGRYQAALGRLAKGDWDLRATATAAKARTLDFEAELTWP